MIDAACQASSRRSKDLDQRLRAFKIALKTCRFCLDNDELQLALKVLERCADYASNPEQASPILRIANAGSDEDGECRSTFRRLTAEYYLLRIAHACKSDQGAVAEHFFGKVDVSELAKTVNLAEKAADLFHEAGKAFASQRAAQDAVKWCERALVALDSCDVEQLSQNGAELRLAVASTLVEVVTMHPEPSLHQRVVSLIGQLETVHGLGNRMAVWLLRFKLLIAAPDLGEQGLSKVLSQVIRLAVLTNKSFKIIMQAIHKTRRRHVGCAIAALKELIIDRLVPDANASQDDNDPAQERLERASVTYTLFASDQSEQPASALIASFAVMFDTLSRHNLAFTAKATHAAQTLIWKATGAADDEEVASAWCRLLRHPIFDSAGQLNKARIGRKAMVMAMARGDMQEAREAFYQMPAGAQNDDASRYLAFKLALRESDYELAQESLNLVSRHSHNDPEYLYACVLEAQQSGMRMMAVAALQALLDQQPPGIHLPSLLRCTARLLIAELETQSRSLNEAMEEVVLVFENAARNTKALRQGPDEQWRTEVQWWSKNAYNLALRLCADIHPEHLVRLLAVCTGFLNHLPKDDGVVHGDGALHRRMSCHFLSATALVVLARSEDEGSQYALQCYTQCRRDIATYMEHTEKINFVNTGPKDIYSRAFELLKFDLECILKLHQWKELDVALQKLLDFKHADRWETLIDLVLVIHDHAKVSASSSSSTAMERIPELLQKCVNESWKKDKDIVKMSRWLRLTFTIHVEDERADFALTILQQAATIAQRGSQGSTERYPDGELQFLAISAFNRAIDLLSAGDKLATEQWITGAMELARYAEDNGALHANLTYRRGAAEKRASEGVI